eukprot:GFKZ01007020.1.p1 GENE.GFKZ01007020.1~~GFKZ01007020.1.p1  ORF type:complete len:1038 (-),score=174.13 GFKZ01007020.1:388-3501(-)
MSLQTPLNSNTPVFSNVLHPIRLPLSSSDTVTAVAATANLLWVGTSLGRVIRHDTRTSTHDELRGPLGLHSLNNAVHRIYPDPYSRAALVILRNADGYHAHATGPVRPRWLSKLRGLRVMSASWIRVPTSDESKPDVSTVLLGTAFGALFSLAIDEKYERDDVLQKLWAAPNSERIDGVRVERVAGKFVGTVATTSALYLFSDAPKLTDLFQKERLTVVDRSPHVVVGEDKKAGEGGVDELLPSELQFMTGNSGVASRRFVWAAATGVMHAQLAVKRRRQPVEEAHGEGDTGKALRSTVMAAVQDMEVISWTRLKDTSGSAVPLACNLSAFHVLVLYPASVYAFNQISGQLTQRVTVWSPTGTTVADDKKGSDWSLQGGRTRTSPTASEASTPVRGALAWEEAGRADQLLSSPAAGFARDVLTDALWIYTEDGEISKLVASDEEQKEAWKAAKATNRFDLAMALAPLVSSGMEDDEVMFQTREAVLEAQADHEAAEGNWDVAAQLYAKTNRPIESVMLDIVDSCSTQAQGEEDTSTETDGLSRLRALGIGPRLLMTTHMITYLVRKLDRTESSRPMQRTIIATMLVQLYATRLSSETDAKLREEVREDFGHFLADRHADLDTSTAVAILNKNGCHEEAWTLAVLSGDISTAAEISSRRGQIDRTLSLLKNSNITGNTDKMSQLVCHLSRTLVPQAPQKVSSSIGRIVKKDGQSSDHITVVQGLARVARDSKDSEVSTEAYRAATVYLFDLLHDWKIGAGLGDPSVVDGTSSSEWHNLITFLFQLHSEFGTETEAQRSFDQLVAPRLPADASGMSDLTLDTLGAILRSSANGGFHRLRVHLYQALSLHVTAIQLAVEIDPKLAEAKVGLLRQTDMPENLKKSLWCLVASKSEDPVGVVERSKGLLHIEDVLRSMVQFESATERVKTAVASSLEEHKRLANVAKSDATAALEVTSSLREDLEKARAWQNQRVQHRRNHRRKSQPFSWGHHNPAVSSGGSGQHESRLPRVQAIMSIDAPFDSGHTLPLEILKPRKGSRHI